MPFTLSHPAAAVPLKRFGFNVPALVVGSMSPDFIYILKLAPKIGYTHTLPGLFTFCLPASWVVLLLYQLLQRPLTALVPGPMHDPAPIARAGFKGIALVTLSILVGACTHIVWDGFTHETGWMAAFWPALNRTALDLGFDHVSLARLLHHASSLVGGAWLALQIKRRLAQAWDMEADCPGCRSLVPASAILVASAGLGWLYAWMRLRPILDYDQVREMMLRGMAASGAALILLLLLYSLAWHFGRRMRPAMATTPK